MTSHHHVSDRWELQSHNLEGDAIIVGSKQWAEDVVERGAAPERVVCIPYGVDASRFVPPSLSERAKARQSLGIAPDAIVVGFFAKRSSNERDRKGTDIFAAAVELLSRELPKLAVLIIGPGWDELVGNLTTSGVTCVWQPFIRDGDRMPSMYQALDFYWVTARVEGGPVTLLEAMSTGLCCITTPVGLAKEIVQDGMNGIVVNFDDTRAFVSKTLEYSANAGKRAELGQNARDTILGVMDIPVTAQGIGKAYTVASDHFAATESVHHTRGAGSVAPPLSTSILAQIALLERLTWAEALILQGQKALAMRIMFETWLSHPLSSLPPRYILRNVLPSRLVSAIVGSKRAITGANSQTTP